MTHLRRRLLLTAALVVCLLGTTFGQARPTDRVYVTKTGAKYHRDGCSSLSRSKIPMALSEAAARYAPCKNCKPPVLSAEAVTSAASPTAKQAPARTSVEAGRCQATTKKGTQCSRRAKPGSRYCWQHG